MRKIDLTGRPFYLNPDQIAWVEKTAAALTNEQKVGQLFCLMAGDYSEAEQEKLARDYCVGAFLFRPVLTAQGLRQQYERLDRVSRIPLLKAANLEEGGAGGYLGGTKFAYQEGVAACNDPAMAEKFALVTAEEARQSGINWTFSPVSDIDLNFRNPITNIRTFGSRMETVRDYTRIFVETVQKHSLAACAKHFPGDGVDYRDQHLHPTYNTLSAKEWFTSYGAVYQNMIEADLLSVMVGHIVQPAVERYINPDLTDEELLPGSMSRELLAGVLRGLFRFNGVITTDATIMGGYTMAMEREKAIPATIEAGCDMIVFTPDFYQDRQYLLNALKKGRLSQQRLDEALLRILALKAKIAVPDFVQQKRKTPILSPEEIKQYTRECADKAVTLVKNNRNILPVRAGRYRKIRLINVGKDDTADGSLTGLVTEYLKKQGLIVQMYDPFADELHSPEREDEDTLTLYLCCKEAESNVTTVRIDWCKKHALDIPRYVKETDSVFLSFGNPYMLQDIPRLPAYVNAYTATKVTVEATLDKVFGKSEFRGVSPVDPFCGLPDTHL